EVGDRDRGSRSRDGGERLEDRVSAVGPPTLGRGPDHGCLAAYLVGGQREVETLARPDQKVERGYRRLDHEDVGAFPGVEVHLPQRLPPVREVHLVRLAVTEAGGRPGRLPERRI